MLFWGLLCGSSVVWSQTTTVRTRLTGAQNWSAAATWIRGLSGTVNLSTASTMVTGTGTLFTSQLQVGDVVMLSATPGTVQGTVASIQSDAQLTLAANPVTTISGAAFGKQGVPMATDTVEVGNLSINTAALTLTLDLATANVAAMRVIGGNFANVLQHTGTNVLNVSGNVELQQPIAVATNSWAINAGTANVAGRVTLASTTITTSRIRRILLTTGTLDVEGDIVYQALTSASSTLAVIDMSGAATLRVAGSMMFSGTASGTLTPGSFSTVIYDGTGAQTVIEGSSIAYRNLTINKPSGTATLLATGGVAGDFLIQQGTFSTAAISLTVTGTFVNYGTYSATTGGLSTTGLWTNYGTYNTTTGSVTATAGWVNNGTFTCTSNATVTTGGNWTNTGTFTPGTGTLQFTGTVHQTATNNQPTLNLYNLTVNKTAGTVYTSGITRMNLRAYTQTNGCLVAPDTMDLSSTATLTLDTLTAGNVLYIAGNLINRGRFEHNNKLVVFDGTGTQYLGGNQVTTFYNLRVANTASGGLIDTVNMNLLGTMDIALSNSMFTANPGIVVNASGAAGTLTGVGTIRCTRVAATPDFVTQYKFSTLTLTGLKVEYTGAGAQTVSALSYSRLSIAGTGTKTAGGNLSTVSSLNINAGVFFDLATYTLAGTLASNTGTGTLRTQNLSSAPIAAGKTWPFIVNYDAATGGQSVVSGTYTTLTIGATSGTQTAVGTITCNTALTVPAGAVLSMETQQLAGTLTTMTGTGTIRTKNTSSAPLTTGKTWPFTIEYNAPTGGQSVVGATYSTLRFSHASGTSTAVANSTVNTSLIATGGGVFNAAGTTLTIKGDWSITGGSTFSSTGTVLFNGTVNQNVASAGSFFNIQVNKSATDVVLTSDVTLGGTLTFTLGKITTGSYAVYSTSRLFSGAAQATGWVNGFVRLPFSSGVVSGTFPVGGPSYYAPVSVTFAAVSAAGTITAASPQNVHPNILSSNILTTHSIPRHWSLAAGGGLTYTTYTVSLNWNTAQNYAGLNPTHMSVGRYNAGAWTLPAVVGTPTTSNIQAGGIPALGDFIVGDSCSVSATISYTGSPFAQTGTASVTHTGDAGGTYTATAGLSINATTGAVNLAASTAGYHTITYTIPPGSGCGTYTTTADVHVYNTCTWTGASGTAWTTAGNWSASTVPGTYSKVSIPAGLTNYPLVSTGTAEVYELTLSAPTSLTVSGGTFKLRGLISGTGKINALAGTFEYNGSAAQTIASGRFTSNEVRNLTVNNAAGLTLGGALGVSGVLNLAVGNLTAGSNLTLLSTATRTALIDGSGTGQVTGSVNVQRYLANKYGYHYLASPLTAAPVAEWSDDVDLTASFPRLYRYDEDLVTAGWAQHTATSGALNVGEGYACNLGITTGATTVDMAGTVNNGPITFPNLTNHNNPSTQGFNLVGNPYPSPIDWDAAAGWNRTAIDNAVYYFDAGTASPYTGTYHAYINGVSSNGIANNIIPAMQAFFVHVSNGAFPVTGAMSIDNAARVSVTNPTFHKTTGGAPHIRIAASFDDGAANNGLSDGAVLYFDDDAPPAFDNRRDALKMLNTDERVPNLYLMGPEAERLSIDATPIPANWNAPTAIYPLGVQCAQAGWVSFTSASVVGLPGNVNVFLADAQSGEVRKLVEGASHRVHLQSGTHHDRFFLLLSEQPSVALPWTGEEAPVYTADGTVFAFTPRAGTEVTVLNTLGQVVHRTRAVTGGLQRIRPAVPAGIYIISIADAAASQAGGGRKAKKVFIGEGR